MDKSNGKIYVFFLIPVFIWIGFVCSISFMEAWLKFRAPHVTLSIGLGIGKLIFSALNKMEWVFAGLTLLLIYTGNYKLKNFQAFLLYASILILMIQSFYLLPDLYTRADLLAQNIPVAPSYTHITYILLEAFKVIALFLFGFQILLKFNLKPS